MGAFSKWCGNVVENTSDRITTSIQAKVDNVSNEATRFADNVRSGNLIDAGMQIASVVSPIAGLASSALSAYTKIKMMTGGNTLASSPMAATGFAGQAGSLLGLGASAGMAGGAGQDKDTYVFAVEIDSIECAKFQDCSGLSLHTDIVEVPEGGENTTTRKFYGDTHYDNVRLSNGVTGSDNSLLEWLQKTVMCKDGTIEKRNGALIMKSLAGDEVKRWNMYGLIPVKWDLPTNNKSKAKNSAVVIENIEFAIDRFELG